LLQGTICLRLMPPARREHDSPMRRGENVARRPRGVAGWLAGQNRI